MDLLTGGGFGGTGSEKNRLRIEFIKFYIQFHFNPNNPNNPNK